MNQFKINGSLISVAQDKNDDTTLDVKFLICPLDEGNGNKVGLREKDLTDEEKIGLIGQPLVCKVVTNSNGEYDFSGHNYKKIRELNSKGEIISKTDFDTYPIGYHTEMNIEDIFIDGVSKRCFIATAKIWKRYWRAIEVIERLGNTLKTSWEISYDNFYLDKGIKWLTDIKWLGNCCLGSNVKPAYGDAGLLEVAEEDVNMQLAMALSEDIHEFEIKEKEKSMESNKDLEKDKKTNEETSTDELKKDESVDEKKELEEHEMSSLTERDIYRKVDTALCNFEEEWHYIVRLYPLENRFIACREWSQDTDDELYEYTYSLIDEEVKIESKREVKMVFVARDLYDEQVTELSSKEEKIVALSETILNQDAVIKEKDVIVSELENKIKEKEIVIAELEPFKVKVEEIENAKKEAELAKARTKLKEQALASKYITEEEIEASEVLKKAIENLDEKAIKVAIAEKVMESANISFSTSKIEVSEIKQDLNTNAEYSYENGTDALLKWIKSKRK